MRLIDKDKLIKSFDCICTAGGIWQKPQLAYLEACKEYIEDYKPELSADEGIRIIWQAQLDELIAKMQKIMPNNPAPDSKMEYYFTGINDCISILQEAKC